MSLFRVCCYGLSLLPDELSIKLFRTYEQFNCITLSILYIILSFDIYILFFLVLYFRGSSCNKGLNKLQMIL